MKTGIAFFDEQEFQPGDVVVIGGFVGSGKTLLTTALAGGLVKNADSEVFHVDLETPHLRWAERVGGLDLSEEEQARLTYRGMAGGAFSPEDFGHAALVVDHMGIMASKEEIHEVARAAKLYAVRQKTVVVLAFQLSRELGGRLNAEGWIDPARLPEWVLEFGDQIYFLRNGVGDERMIPMNKDRLLPALRSVVRVKANSQFLAHPDDWTTLDFFPNRVNVGR